MTHLIQYAMKVEKAMFEAAISQDEYYQLLVEKIYRIRKDLEQRRMMKSAMENRQMGGESSQVLSVIKACISDKAVAV